jgi:hypothetical protein
MSIEQVRIPSCALDEDGIAAQRNRYARLAPSVTRVGNEPQAVSIEFRAGFDRAALDEALAVERECCPFFVFEVDEPESRLRVTVRDAEHLAALEALAHAFTGAR